MMKVFPLGLALMAMFGGCKQRCCCPQCRANLDALNYQWRVVRELKCDVRDMKRGYRTVPVRVAITNAWEETK